mgnify:CR=1 FL=1
MCFPIGVGMKESTTKDYKVINEEIFNPIEKKKKVQHYTCRDIISDINSEALFADGFDDAIVGYDAVGFRVVYDYDKCSDILMKRDGMTEHEAHEFMEFNVVSAFVGEFTPLFINKI